MRYRNYNVQTAKMKIIGALLGLSLLVHGEGRATPQASTQNANTFLASSFLMTASGGDGTQVLPIQCHGTRCSAQQGKEKILHVQVEDFQKDLEGGIKRALCGIEEGLTRKKSTSTGPLLQLEERGTRLWYGHVAAGLRLTSVSVAGKSTAQALALAAGKGQALPPGKVATQRWMGRYHVLEMAQGPQVGRISRGNMVVTRARSHKKKRGQGTDGKKAQDGSAITLSIDLTRPDTKKNKGVYIGPGARHRTLTGIRWEANGRIHLKEPAAKLEARPFSPQGDVLAGVLEDGVRVIAWVAVDMARCGSKSSSQRKPKSSKRPPFSKNLKSSGAGK